jgi:opacity protein-like surface antigen
MTGLKAFLRGILGTVAFATAAQAADPPGTWAPPREYAPRYVELLSGWYLRADLGYRWNHVGSVETAVPTTSQSINNSVGATVGAGFKYHWFRTDMTLDYGSPADFQARTAAAATQPRYSSRLDAVSGLINFYADFGTWGGFTPYAGAGLGATRLRSQQYVDTTMPVTGTSHSTARTNFSWAWMAGVAFQVKPQWLVDVGFRHLELGNVNSTTGTGLPTDFMRLKNLSANEVRIGLRYLLD